MYFTSEFFSGTWNYVSQDPRIEPRPDPRIEPYPPQPIEPRHDPRIEPKPFPEVKPNPTQPMPPPQDPIIKPSPSRLDFAQICTAFEATIHLSMDANNHTVIKHLR